MQHNAALFKMPWMTRDDDPKAYIEAFERTTLQSGKKNSTESLLLPLTSSHGSFCRMEPVLDPETIFRPSYIASVELPLRTGPVNVEDIKTNLSDEFSLAASSLDMSQLNSFECKEHVQVCLRIRPFTSSEKEREFQECVSIQDSTSVILKAPKNSMACRLSEKNMGQMTQKFMFSHVFGPETTQEEFFEGTMKQPVQDFLEGHSHLIFTYGVTNAGKTYTFQGTEDDVGILPRTMDMLFKRVHGKMYPEMDLKPHRCREYIKLTKEQMKEEIAFKNSVLRLTKETDSQNSNCSKTSDESEDLEEVIKESEQSITTEGSHMKFSLWVSFCEIYNECIYDLLFPITNDKKRKLLRLAQDIKGCSYVRDLQWVQISNAKEAFRLLKLGLKHQSIACTKLNTCSSRSHSIFTVKILRIEDSKIPLVTQVSELVLCDLAGSERCTKTRNEGDRLKESGNINTSLLILGKCINALKNSQQSKLQQHIPFRESKLTHLLQGFFNGRGKVHMIVNISQCASAYDETLSVLKFSAVAQKILVLDTYNPPQEQSFGQKSVREVPFVSDNNTKMQVARKRATILWDRSLEDVMEVDDCIMHDNEMQAEQEMVKDMPKAEEEHDKSIEMPKEKMEGHEGSEIVIGKEEYLPIKDTIQERTNGMVYYASIRWVALNRERELLEETSEKRLEIYKDLVNECIKLPDEEEKIKDARYNEQAATLEEGNVVPKSCIYLEGIIDSLENDVTDIKKHAEEVHSYIVSLQDPQEAIAWLEKQFKEVTTELTKTKEELTQRTKELNIQVAKLSEYTQQLNETTEKMTTKNKQIQELIHITEQKDDVIARLQDLISHLEATMKNYDSDVTTIKKEIAKENINKRIQDVQLSELVENVLEVGRKRRSENKLTQEEEPPTKRGCIQNKCKDDALEQTMLKELKQNISEKDAEMLALKERYENLECQLTALKEEFKNEKTEKEGISEQMAGLHLQLSRKEERVFGLSEELQQSQANYEKIVFELEMESNVRDLEEKCKNSDKKIKELNDQETKLKEEVLQLKDNLKTTEQSLQEKERENERKKEAAEQLSKDLSESSSVIQHLNIDLQRKDEEYADLKEKLADAKKQIQQVQKEVCTMRSEENCLRNKVNELEKTKNQLGDELDIKQRTIQQLKEQSNNEKMEEILKQYDNACKDLCAKKKIIEDMRLTLKEQEETQMEQDQVLEAKLEENERLVSELEEWKQKYKELEKQSSGNKQQIISKHKEESIDVRGEQIKLQERLEESEEKYKADRKKWLEEKMGLITQVKEAENHRNREMRRFAEDRERYVKQQTEMERLTAQLAEKDNNLQKWREERDQLVKALEVQLKTLPFSNVQKDKEIEELKQTTLKGSGKEYEIVIEQLRRELAERDNLINELKQTTCHENPKSARVPLLPKQRLSKTDESSHNQQKKEENNRVTGQCVPVKENEVKGKSLLHCPSNASSLNEIEDHSDTVLDSSEVSTENGQTSRFPKPEMEIQFTPLQPNKMEVKHQGSALPVTVKMSKTRRKRKSDEMDEDSVKHVNKKNTTSMTNNRLPITSNSATINKMKVSFRKEYPLRNQQSTSSMKSTRKKDGTLQKLGDFLQSSPIIIHSKAKKLIETISSPKSAQVENHKENQPKPKRTKRRLYSAAISSPLNIPGHLIVMDQKEKESDHLIMKRRLRTKTAK
ncbi:kinesin-like protein KIF20B isoform C [Alligator mississippiensis]|uniref:Kinesin-like protein KIF20B isoform C n=1 Tax=Alligator mississippiensis TaxID=8496 RepID=A0A151NZZ0_ALLMI|nr:kinesin-like protein KIF20B isoform C [Alligator mississippiensis]